VLCLQGVTGGNVFGNMSCNAPGQDCSGVANTCAACESAVLCLQGPAGGNVCGRMPCSATVKGCSWVADTRVQRSADERVGSRPYS
jgi:hypothetical protein